MPLRRVPQRARPISAPPACRRRGLLSRPQRLSAYRRSVRRRSGLLLVDDQSRNLLALEALLRAPLRELVGLQCGYLAIDEVRRREFSLVLDPMMPRIDGLETAAELERVAPRLPFIVLSAYAEDEELSAKARSTGALDYVAKPVDPAVLCGTIARSEGRTARAPRCRLLRRSAMGRSSLQVRAARAA